MDVALRGNKITGGAGPSRTYAQGRVCAKPDCDTKLSQYNRREYCFTHAPTRFPRLRGRVASD